MEQEFFSTIKNTGKLFNINGVIWLIQPPNFIVNDSGEKELGWNAYDMSKGAAYHFFTESELKTNNYVIQEF